MQIFLGKYGYLHSLCYSTGHLSNTYSQTQKPSKTRLDKVKRALPSMVYKRDTNPQRRLLFFFNQKVYGRICHDGIMQIVKLSSLPFNLKIKFISPE